MPRRRELVQTVAFIQPKHKGGNGKLHKKLMGVLFTNLARVHACNLVHKLRSPVVTRFFRAQSRGRGEVFS